MDKADAVEGARLFRTRCSHCHTIAKGGMHKSGPNLYGIYGAMAGQTPWYMYSPANKEINVRWTAKNLDSFLEDPKRFMPGNKMSFQGMKDPQQRAHLIAFIAQQSDLAPMEH